MCHLAPTAPSTNYRYGAPAQPDEGIGGTVGDSGDESDQSTHPGEHDKPPASGKWKQMGRADLRETRSPPQPDARPRVGVVQGRCRHSCKTA
jgi:hypothetical protein